MTHTDNGQFEQPGTDCPLVRLAMIGQTAVVTFQTPTIGGGTDIETVSAHLREHLARAKPRNIIVDFSGVTFFSSMMLGLLVDLWKRLRDQGGQLLICGVQPHLTRVFRITNLDTLFEFAPDRRAAIARLGEANHAH